MKCFLVRMVVVFGLKLNFVMMDLWYFSVKGNLRLVIYKVFS